MARCLRCFRPFYAAFTPLFERVAVERDATARCRKGDIDRIERDEIE